MFKTVILKKNVYCIEAMMTECEDAERYIVQKLARFSKLSVFRSYTCLQCYVTTSNPIYIYRLQKAGYHVVPQ